MREENNKTARALGHLAGLMKPSSSLNFSTESYDVWIWRNAFKIPAKYTVKITHKTTTTKHEFTYEWSHDQLSPNLFSLLNNAPMPKKKWWEFWK